MAFLPSYSDFNSYLKGNTDEDSLFGTNPILKSGTGPAGAQTFGAPTGPAGAETFGSTSSSAAAPGPSSPAPQPSTPSSTPSTVQPGSGVDRYFQPIGAGVQANQKKLDEAYKTFSQGAGGMRREFGDPEKQELAEAYKAPDADSTAKAKSYVGAKYTGPQGLAQEDVSAIGQGAKELRDQARGLRTTSGLQTTIQNTTPGLTGGMARFEARDLLKDPGIKERSRAAEESVNQFSGGLAAGTQKAQDYAGLRSAQEADLAQKSRGFLEEQRAGITGEIDTRVGAEQGKQDAAQKAYDDLLKASEENNSPADAEQYLARLQDAQKYSDDDLSKLDSDQAKLTREAQAKYDSILADQKYAAIADRPLLTRNITARGKEYWNVVGPDGKQVDIRKAKDIPQATQKLLIKRQEEIEENFRQQGGKRDRDSGSKKSTEGKYSDVMSLNLHGEPPPLDEGGDPVKGGIVTPPDPQLHKFMTSDPSSFLSFDPGVSPSRQNVGTAAEKKQVNSINELLDEVDRLGDAEPMRAAKIAAGVEAYLLDEASNLQARADAGDKGAESWRKQIAKARKRYKGMKEAQGWAVVTNAIVSIVFPPAAVYYAIGSGVATAAGADGAYQGGSADPLGNLGGKLVTGYDASKVPSKTKGVPTDI